MKQWLIFAVKAAVSGALIWWLLARIDTASVIEGLGRVSVGPLVLALVTILFATGLLSLRWTAVNKLLDIPLRLARALRLTFIGLFFSQTLPSTIGGDFMRVWFVYRDGIPMDRAASSVVLDRLCAFAALLMVVGLSLPMLFAIIEDSTPRWSLPLIVVLGICGFVTLFALGGRLGDIFARWKVTRAIVVLARDARRLNASFASLVQILAMALAIHLLMVLAVWLIGQSIGAGIALLHCLVFVPPVTLISLVPVSVAGWGIREGAMIVAFGFVGVPEADSLVVSVLLGLILVAAGAPGGLMWLAEGRASRRGFGFKDHSRESES